MLSIAKNIQTCRLLYVSTVHVINIKHKSSTEAILSPKLCVYELHFLSVFQSGDNAAALIVAEQYVQAFGNLAKTSNTVILPANTGDAASMVAQVCGLIVLTQTPV